MKLAVSGGDMKSSTGGMPTIAVGMLRNSGDSHAHDKRGHATDLSNIALVPRQNLGTSRGNYENVPARLGFVIGFR
jgi:hypothetical protein